MMKAHVTSVKDKTATGRQKDMRARTGEDTCLRTQRKSNLWEMEQEEIQNPQSEVHGKGRGKEDTDRPEKRNPRTTKREARQPPTKVGLILCPKVSALLGEF